MSKEPPKKRSRQLRQVDGQLNLIDLYKRTRVGKPGNARLPTEVNATNEGKPVRYAIHHMPADGNCMFSAVAHQLGPRISESSEKTAHQVRLEIVEYLRNHPDIVEAMVGTHDIELHRHEEANLLQEGDGGLQKYLARMSKSGIFGDSIMLSAAGKLYGRSITVLGLDNEMRTVLHSIPVFESPTGLQPITLGYYALSGSDKRNHYASLSLIQDYPATAQISQPSSSSVSQSPTDLTSVTTESEATISADGPALEPPTAKKSKQPMVPADAAYVSINVSTASNLTLCSNGQQVSLTLSSGQCSLIPTSTGQATSSSSPSSTAVYPIPSSSTGEPRASASRVIVIRALEEPCHPDVSKIPPLITNNRKFYFQKEWFKTHPWLHFDPSSKGMLCFHCAKASAFELLSSVKRGDDSFITTGFTNWKKGYGQESRFKVHESSNCHSFACEALHNMLKAMPVANMLNKQLTSDQAVARKSLNAIFTTVQYLGRQGIALRGHDDAEGNFMQLLKFRSNDVPELLSWLSKAGGSTYTHHSIQNEILTIFSDAILRKIIDQVAQSHSFAIVMDGTQDINKTEQESICFRFVDDNFDVFEEFTGFYAVDGTTGSNLAACVKDVLLRFQLPIEKLRGQTYDGASNMSGAYKGCQAIIAEMQPLAMYVHCGAHCTNLIASAAVSSSSAMHESVQLINDFGVLCSQSGKFKALFGNFIASGEQAASPVRYIKPLCPTRWLVRLKGIKATLQQYERILEALQESQSECSNEVRVRAAGLLKRFDDGCTLMWLYLAESVLEPLECLNKSLQSVSMTVAGMIESTEAVKTLLQQLRTETIVDDTLARVQGKINDLDLSPLVLPRARQPPKRFTGLAAAHQPNTIAEFFREQYFAMIDVCIQQLDDRILNCPGMVRYRDLLTILLSGAREGCVGKVAKDYPELTPDGIRSIQSQLVMFHNLPSIVNHKPKPLTLDVFKKAFQVMMPDMRAMFPQVEALLRLLLVNPASSAEAERSFSGLRRLKTYLRSTSGQQRLNNIAMCHIHSHILDDLNIDELVKQFISRKDNRMTTFGGATA